MEQELDAAEFAQALEEADVFEEGLKSPLMTCPTPSRRDSLTSVATEATSATTSTVAGVNQHVRVVVRVRPAAEDEPSCMEWAGDKVCVQPPEQEADEAPQAPRTPGRAGAAAPQTPGRTPAKGRTPAAARTPGRTPAVGRTPGGQTPGRNSAPLPKTFNFDAVHGVES